MTARNRAANPFGRLFRPRRYGLITGCPRSGTTAVLEWLGREPGVVAFDEPRIHFATFRLMREVDRFTALARRRRRIIRAAREIVKDRLRARPRARIRLVKEPLEPVALPDADYEDFIRHTRELFPTLRILFMIRHPVPTLWSMRSRKWGYSLTAGEPRDLSIDEGIDIWRRNAELAVRIRDERRTMVLRHEDLIADPAGVSGRVRRFLGLPDGRPLEPKPTAEVGFDEALRAHILAETADARGALGY